MNDSDIIYSVIFSTLIILLLVAGVAITIFISNKQRTAQEIKMVQLQLGYEKELRTVQYEVQEQVMTNVARELHDNIGQMLTIMHIQLEQKKLVAPDMTSYLDPIHKTLQDVTHQVKMLGRSLNTELPEQQGLLQAIYGEVGRLKELNKVAIEWQSDNVEPALTQDQRLMVFRILQEVLNNALKHAKANMITISMAGKPFFKLEIIDNGVGFTMSEQLQGVGSGLKNIIKRASLSDLACNVTTALGCGCRVTLEPLKQ